jgi:hypothetical protein
MIQGIQKSQTFMKATLQSTSGDYSYDLNADGSLTNTADGSQVEFHKRVPGGAAFETPSGTKIYSTNSELLVRPKSGAIEPMGFSSPFFALAGLFRGVSSNPVLSEVPASAPVGRLGSPMEVTPGTNTSAVIGGRRFTGHALDQMQGRGLTPTVFNDAIDNGIRSAGHGVGETVHITNGVKAVTLPDGAVKTVMPKTH